MNSCTFPAWIDASEPIPTTTRRIERLDSRHIEMLRASLPRIRPELQLHTVFTTRPVPSAAPVAASPNGRRR